MYHRFCREHRVLTPNLLKCMMIVLVLGMAGDAPGGEQQRWGFSVGSGPHKVEAENYIIVLGSAADQSPVPSVVELRNASGKRAITIGAVYNNLSHESVFDVGLNLRFGNGYLGGDLRMELGPRKRVGSRGKNTFSYFGGLVITGVTGNLGQVGTAPGDEYLQAPDGNTYSSGSDIDIWGFTVGLSAGLQLILEPSKEGGGAFFIRGGWQASAPIDEWHYTVSDGSETSELPASGFGGDPAKYGSSGPFLAVGGLF